MTKQDQAAMISDLETIRLDNGTLEISWKTSSTGLSVDISAGTEPEAPERFASLRSGVVGTRAEFKDLDSGCRYYFLVRAGSKKPIMTAERRVPLEGAVNFRDLGGYKAAGGRCTVWGRIFRSDALTRLTDSDRELLISMGIKRVFDFRTMGEVEAAPDLIPPDFEYTNLPISHGEFNFIEAMKRLKKGDASWMTPDFMRVGYLENLAHFGRTFGQVLKAAADAENRPLVFHCTGGKDRAGTAAALLLLALGVPDDQVIEDHGLSNIYIARLLDKVYEMIESYGVDPKLVEPYFTAPRDCIEALLERLYSDYGSIDAYLVQKAGMDEATLARLRDELLE